MCYAGWHTWLAINQADRRHPNAEVVSGPSLNGIGPTWCRWKQSMVPLKKVRKDTSSPSDSTCRTLAFTSMPAAQRACLMPEA